MRIAPPPIEVTIDGYWAYLDTPYNERFIKYVKQFPGRKWDKAKRMWRLPLELYDESIFALHFPGAPVEVEDSRRQRGVATKPNESLYPFQLEGVDHVLSQEGVGMLNFEMGLGKTPTAIEVLKQLQPKRTLIVSPAIVRLNWADELRKWGWREPVEVAASGAQAKKIPDGYQGIVITSYELLGYFKAQTWDAFILDESHYVKNNKAQRSKTVKAIRQRNPAATCLCLTATPITSEPKDLWNQLDILWPGRFGTFWQFVNRYSNIHHNGYGTEIKGANGLHAEELHGRLSEVACRITKHEVAHLLPPFLVQTIRVKSKKKWNQREMLEALSSGVKRQHDLQTFCEQAGNEKFQKAIELVKELQTSATHVCVMTHFRDTAHKIAEELGDNAFVVTGNVTPKKRMEIIKGAEALPNAVLVCTMHSVGIGIDLTKFTAAVFAELYWQPAAVVQALGRFSRLSGKDPSTCYLLVLEGSLDEPIAHTLKRRLLDQAKLYNSGVSEEKMLAGFEVPDDEWLEELRQAATVSVEDEYL